MAIRSHVRRFGAAILVVAAAGLPSQTASASAAATLVSLGGAPALTLGEGGDRAVSVVATPSGNGVWVAHNNGAVTTAGDATSFGDLASAGGRGHVVELVATPTGAGYWLFTREGGVFSFGDAVFQGANPAPAEPIVAAAGTITGNGYWTVSGRGTVTSYGDAAPVTSVTASVIDIVASPDGNGVWTIGPDGGVFALANASFFGSAAGLLGTPVVDADATGPGGLLLLTAAGDTVPLGAATSPGTATQAAGSVALAFDVTSAGAVVASGPARVWRHALMDLPANSGAGRRIVYANRQQQVWIVDESNTVVRTYLVSGRANTPYAGSYRVQSKSPKAWARGGGIYMYNMVRFNGGIGFHEIPRYPHGAPMQTESELGLYRSHGCVRQAIEDAAFLYSWARVGDLVVVLP